MKNWAEGIFRYIFYMTQSLIDIPFKVINYVIKNGIDIPYNHEIMLVIYVLAVNITFIFTINRIMWMLLEQEKIDYKNIVIRFGLTIGGIFGLQYILHFLNWIKDIMILGFYKEVNLDKFIDVEPLLQWIINYETHASVKAFFLTFLICFSLIICSVLIYFIGNMFLTILKIYILTVFMPLYISCIANEDYEKEGIEALKKYFGYLYKLAVFYLNIYFISYIFSNDIIKRIIETSFPNFSEVKVQNLTYLIEASLGTVLLIMTGSFLVLIYKNNKRKKILKQKLKEDKKLLKLKLKEDKKFKKKMKKDIKTERKQAIKEILEEQKKKQKMIDNFKLNLKEAKRNLTRLKNEAISNLKTINLSMIIKGTFALIISSKRNIDKVRILIQDIRSGKLVIEKTLEGLKIKQKSIDKRLLKAKATYSKLDKEIKINLEKAKSLDENKMKQRKLESLIFKSHREKEILKNTLDFLKKEKDIKNIMKIIDKKRFINFEKMINIVNTMRRGKAYIIKSLEEVGVENFNLEREVKRIKGNTKDCKLSKEEKIKLEIYKLVSELNQIEEKDSEEYKELNIKLTKKIVNLEILDLKKLRAKTNSKIDKKVIYLNILNKKLLIEKEEEKRIVYIEKINELQQEIKNDIEEYIKIEKSSNYKNISELEDVINETIKEKEEECIREYQKYDCKENQKDTITLIKEGEEVNLKKDVDKSSKIEIKKTGEIINEITFQINSNHNLKEINLSETFINIIKKLNLPHEKIKEIETELNNFVKSDERDMKQEIWKIQRIKIEITENINKKTNEIKEIQKKLNDAKLIQNKMEKELKENLEKIKNNIKNVDIIKLKKELKENKEMIKNLEDELQETKFKVGKEIKKIYYKNNIKKVKEELKEELSKDNPDQQKVEKLQNKIKHYNTVQNNTREKQRRLNEKLKQDQKKIEKLKKEITEFESEHKKVKRLKRFYEKELEDYEYYMSEIEREYKTIESNNISNIFSGDIENDSFDLYLGSSEKEGDLV